jgi:hypothetical protein
MPQTVSTENFSKIDVWTGRWRWNTETADFGPSGGHDYQGQVQDVTVADGSIHMQTTQTLADGTTRTWTYDGAFDGQPRPITWDHDGSVMAVIAFVQLGDVVAGDAVLAPDGSFAGAEHVVVADDEVKVYGSLRAGGKHYTYFEEWSRIE